MKNFALPLLCVSAAVSPAYAATAALTAQSPVPEQLGYSYGYAMGRSNAETLSRLQLPRFVQGLFDGVAGKTPSLTDAQMANLLSQFKKSLEAKQLLEMQQQALENNRLGTAFLANNAKANGVKTSSTGLQYLVLQQGSGKSPTANGWVKVNYEGRLIDNTVFDSSVARDQAVDLHLAQTIAGLSEGILAMREGGKSRFFMPAALAYGEIGSGNRVPPSSTVIFDVELIAVLPEKP